MNNKKNVKTFGNHKMQSKKKLISMNLKII